MSLLNLLFWLTFTAAFAYGQGLLMPRLKQVLSGTTEAKRHDFALHRLFVVVWLLPVLPWGILLPWWEVVAVAMLLRFVAFDAFLNLAEGGPLFAVGNTADFDRLQQWLAGKLGVQVTVLSALLRLIALVVFVGIILAKNAIFSG